MHPAFSHGVWLRARPYKCLRGCYLMQKDKSTGAACFPAIECGSMPLHRAAIEI